MKNCCCKNCQCKSSSCNDSGWKDIKLGVKKMAHKTVEAVEGVVSSLTSSKKAAPAKKK